jgi:hypothetical protein
MDTGGDFSMVDLEENQGLVEMIWSVWLETVESGDKFRFHVEGKLIVPLNFRHLRSSLPF